MKHLLKSICLALLLSGPAALLRADVALPPVPPQDQGLPYTRTAEKFALAKIKDTVAVFAGSRYAWVYGHKVRLDAVLRRDMPQEIMRAVGADGEIAGLADHRNQRPQR